MSEASNGPPDQVPPPEPSVPPAPEPEAAGRPKGARRAAARRWSRRLLILAIAILASIVVSLFTVDIGGISVDGKSLRTLAEDRASKFLERPMHIGRIVGFVTPGQFAFDDVVIEGPKPGSRPFFSAKRITVEVPWWTMFRRELSLDIRLTGWRMVVENWPDGAHLPRLTSRNPPGGQFPLKIRNMAVYANGGEFIYDDHTTPWSVIARNLQFALVRAGNLNTYVGTAQFSEGTTQIQGFLPMRTDFRTRFQLSGSTVHLRHIDLITDGAESHVTGFVNFGRWPEQEYRINSEVDFNRMREIFFAKETWRLSGMGNFTGIFKFYKGGRELQGEFRSDEAGLGIGRGEWRFPRLHGSLIWTPDRFVVTHAESDLLGGSMRLTYGLVPLGSPGGATAMLTASYDGVDLYRFTRQFGWTALEPQGRMRGQLSMAWPNGRFSAGMQGTGETVVLAPDGTAIAGPAIQPDAPPIEPERPFQKFRPFGAFAIAANTRYRFSASTLDFDPSWVATPSTYVTFSGHARGGPVDVPFHVTSHDWQNSDRLFAAIMNNFGSQMGAIEVGGRGVFDGRLTKAFNAPRIAGSFAGQSMRAWDVVWGAASGDIVIENNYLELTDGRIEHTGGGRVLTSGRYSLGYPRADGGEEIRARVRVEQMPLAPLRHAFGLDDWPVTGVVAQADMDLRGGYERLVGTGRLRLEAGTAWEEPYDSAMGDLVFGGDGSLRLRSLEMEKGGARLAGDAWVSWAEGRYSFRAETQGTGLPLDQVAMLKFERAPLSGQLKFRASGDGEFSAPTWHFDAQVPDLYAGDEGIGALRVRLTLANQVLTLDDVVVASDRLQVIGGGTVSTNPERDATLHLTFIGSSLDPYLKFVARDLPYTRAVVSGSVSVTGPLADTTQLSVGVTVTQASLTLFDYPLTSDDDVRLRFENNRFHIDQLKLRGVDTKLELGGTADMTTRTADLRATGEASLAVLQAFYPLLSASGAATLTASLTGSFDALALDGRAEIQDGRLRHQALPHGLSEINGPIVIREGRISVEDPSSPTATGEAARLRAVMGEGAVTFGGSILLDGYRPQQFDLTAAGRSLRLRYPAGLQSTVDADLALRGPVTGPVLSGSVDVLRASYSLRVRPEAGYFGLAGGALESGGGPSAAGDAPSAFPMGLDIRLRAPLMPFIETKSWTIVGSADVEVRGTIDRPIVTGRVDLDRGEGVFSGYRYRLEGGSIDFSNPLKFDPFFDVSATTRVRSTGQTYNISLRLSGTLSTLDPVIISEPWLPEFQVVSLLFGETPDVGAAEVRAQVAPQELQAQALRTAMVALLASPVSSTVGSVVERATPIDTVQIVPLLGNETDLQQLNPTARITLGKRISDRVYLTYARTLSGVQNEIIVIEIDQNDQISWVLSRNEDRTFALDFRIRYAFR